MPSTKPNEHSVATSLAPTRYDRVASLLISMLVLSSASVALLFVVWLGTTSVKTVDDIVIGHGIGTVKAEGESPEKFETPEITELSNSFGNMTVALSTLLNPESVAAAIDIDTEVLSKSKSIDTKSRPIGVIPNEDVPLWEGWEIRYEATSIESYAKQLDFFGIELGAAGGGKKEVDYARKLSTNSPIIRSATGDRETRFYMTWRGGQLASMDRKLLSKAGIDVEGRVVIQFYPPKIEDSLAVLESKHRKGGRGDEIRKTIFGVRPSEAGYEFYIIEQF